MIQFLNRWFLAIAASAGLFAPAATGQQLSPGAFRAYAETPRVEARISTFSGLAVPRYSSLRSDKVNGRAGPSEDYPVKWVYRRARLPVVVIRESDDWRKIRDPMGDEVWVHRSLLAGERTAAATRNGAIRRDPEARSPALAFYGPGAVMTLQDCLDAWCRVEAEGRKGWALAAELWGVDALPAPHP
jgi:SH3-like domain-containing protein